MVKQATLEFQSTPSGWRVTEFNKPVYFGIAISIHTLRVEGDLLFPGVALTATKISIHTLRVEGDVRRSAAQLSLLVFQSTPSGWRVTKKVIHYRLIPAISIHTLRVEGDAAQRLLLRFRKISIHTLRVEGD